MSPSRRRWILVAALAGCRAAPVAAPPPPAAAPPPELRDPREVHFGAIRQLTRGVGENAEAYWSPDGRQLIFQTKRPPFACDQIMRMPADGRGAAHLVSTGKGQTTCSYFFPDGERVLFASTHERSEACPAPPDHSMGYVWKLHDFEIYASRQDGTDLVRLTASAGYDAEATVCAKDGSIVFTSTRDGDLELYRMDRDGQHVKRLTSTPGYDGGAFFSADCSRLVWRASRPTGGDLDDYVRLLGDGLVRPNKLEIYVADVTPAGLEGVRQVTSLGVASFAPYFHPSGRRILFSSNHGDPRGREFDIWAIDVDGRNLERITFAPGFDGFPMFSPDGTKLAFGSNRNQAKDGETDVYVAEWIDGAAAAASAPAARFKADVAWLADDAREGRGIGTLGLEAAADYVEQRFRELGVAPGVGASYRQDVEVVARQTIGAAAALSIDGRDVAPRDYAIHPASAVDEASGPTVFVGYGVVAPELRRDDYRGKNVKGKIAVVRRHAPTTGAFADPRVQQRVSDLEGKAATARARGAIALLVVDVPEGPASPPAGAGHPGASTAPGATPTEPESPLPTLGRPPMVDAGIPIFVLRRSVGAPLLARSAQVVLRADLQRKRERLANVVGVVRAAAPDPLPGAVVIGAHYDHLGFGEEFALDPRAGRVPHNGADDNASGVAGLLEIARALRERRGELRRDVWLVGFTAEEIGVVGSDRFVRQPPPGLAIGDVVAMINLDMIGRLGDQAIAVQGTDSAAELRGIVEPACAAAGVRCTTGGDGLGPSDHKSFFSAGVPVLYFFTGGHADYHKASDDADKIDAEGGARIAALAGDLALALARRDGRLAFQRGTGTAGGPVGDLRVGGASLGTVPSYSDDQPGMLLDDVRPGGPAELAGLKRGDRIVQIDAIEVRNVRDLMTVLQTSRPGQKAKLTYERAGARATVEVTFGAPRARN